jgi:hypothetical protein
MSEPQIARRCAHCGISLRQSALYCPQCGEQIPENSTEPSTEPTAARAGVADNVRDRVEKIRQVSSVVIDQASYDPSLRFLLVTAALFVLFLVLVILSKVIG